MAAPPIYYLSPHADDVAFSCAGSALLDAAAGHAVTLITVFLSGSDGELRRREDLAAATALGGTYRCLELPDAPDRPEVRGPLDVFMPFGPPHLGITNEVVTRLLWHIRGPAELRAPLAVGGHIDHRIVHEAARAVAYHLGDAVRLTFYEDQPYSLLGHALGRRLAALGVTPPPVGAGRAPLAVEIAEHRRALRLWPMLAAGSRLPGLTAFRCHVVARRAVHADLGATGTGFPPRLRPIVRPLEGAGVEADMLAGRRRAIAAYASQWPLFAASLDGFMASLDAFARRYGSAGERCERLWEDTGVRGPVAS